METKKCPYCGNQINTNAIKCQHCRSKLLKWHDNPQILSKILLVVNTLLYFLMLFSYDPIGSESESTFEDGLIVLLILTPLLILEIKLLLVFKKHFREKSGIFNIFIFLMTVSTISDVLFESFFPSWLLAGLGVFCSLIFGGIGDDIRRKYNNTGLLGLSITLVAVTELFQNIIYYDTPSYTFHIAVFLASILACIFYYVSVINYFKLAPKYAELESEDSNEE